LTVYCLTNWPRRITCWCLTGGVRSEELPQNQLHLFRR
jgi:hypothetical protein